MVSRRDFLIGVVGAGTGSISMANPLIFGTVRPQDDYVQVQTTFKRPVNVDWMSTIDKLKKATNGLIQMAPSPELAQQGMRALICSSTRSEHFYEKFNANRQVRFITKEAVIKKTERVDVLVAMRFDLSRDLLENVESGFTYYCTQEKLPLKLIKDRSGRNVFQVEFGGHIALLRAPLPGQETIEVLYMMDKVSPLAQTLLDTKLEFESRR